MKPTRTVKTADTLLNIIEQLHEGDAGRVTEIANELELAKSTVYDHLATLERRGYVVKEGKTYRLGLRFLDNGTLVRRGFGLEELIQRPLAQLAAVSGETAWFLIEERDRAFFLFRELGERAVDLYGRVGKQAPLHAHAGGKVLLAQRSVDEIDELLGYRGLEPYTESTITDAESLHRELDAIRTQGYALNRDELVAGITSIAAPVFRGDTSVGSICLSGPSNRITGEWTGRNTVGLVEEAAEEISLRVTHEQMRG